MRGLKRRGIFKSLKAMLLGNRQTPPARLIQVAAFALENP